MARYAKSKNESSPRCGESSATTLGVRENVPTRQKGTPAEQQPRYVGIDFHRRRSVIAYKNAAGEILGTVHLDNGPAAFAAELGRRASTPRSSVKRAMDGAGSPICSTPRSEPAPRASTRQRWGNRCVKNDERDAEDLVGLLGLGRLAEAYTAPPPLRELAELVRYRAKLVALAVA